jgi:hypothetical protein
MTVKQCTLVGESEESAWVILLWEEGKNERRKRDKETKNEGRKEIEKNEEENGKRSVDL